MIQRTIFLVQCMDVKCSSTPNHMPFENEMGISGVPRSRYLAKGR
jgi:hypothetical protein